ncbi:MAG: DNA-binding protein, partial [Bacteroidetes bacterium HGW-Bacteroidetes-23]
FLGLAQRGSGGWGTNTNYNRLYNTATVIEIKGKVEKVEKIIPEKGMSTGIHLTMKTVKNELISVHLGPDWFLDNQDVHFAVGDAIIVHGSKVTYESKPAIIAKTIEKGDYILELRNDKGFPKWNGWRQGKNRRGPN